MKKENDSVNCFRPRLSPYAVNTQGKLVRKEKTVSKLIRHTRRAYTSAANLPAVLVFCSLGLILADLLLVLRIVYLFTSPGKLAQEADVHILFAAFIFCSLALAAFTAIGRWFTASNRTHNHNSQHSLFDQRHSSNPKTCFHPVERMRP